jgi:hypothetical protein
MRKITVWLGALALVVMSFGAQAQTQPAAPVEAQPAPAQPPAAGQRPERESVCTGRVDEDGDGMVDCADADCFHDRACEAGNAAGENNNALCSDWIDNDGDGQIDCDDQDCLGPGVSRCRGSWQRGSGGGTSGGGGQTSATSGGGADDVPDLEANQSPEDLIGRNGDLDGERSDETCADGIDNDGDGRTDCADFGCRFDPTVTVCSGSPSLRFSAVVAGGLRYTTTLTQGGVVSEQPDANFTRIQLRGLGPIPGVQNSFFLINLRAERGVRLTFAMFQIPISRRWYFNLNSGSGSLSTSLITSAARQLLLEPAFYVYSAFEQGNGIAAEVGGPLTSDSRVTGRVFAAAGSGEFNGNVGGRFFRGDDQNFTYTAGAQLGVNVIGRFSRFDSPFLYVPVPTTLAFSVGAKWDQRAIERYVAWNVFGVFRWNRLWLSVEHYGKNEFEFGSTQVSGVLQAGLLIIPRRLLIGADIGGYLPGAMSNPPAAFGSAVPRPLSEWQYRAAAHFYFYRHVGVASLVWSDRFIEGNDSLPRDTVREQTLRLEAQFRF